MQVRLNLLLFLSLLMLLGSGCRTIERAQRNFQPSYEAVNVHSDREAPLPENVVRVCVLPVYSGQYEHSLLDRIDHSFQGELAKTMRFEIVPVDRRTLQRHFHQRQILSTDLLPADLFAVLQNLTAADAVLFTELTHFSPYKPLGMGVRSKLVRFSDGAVLWAIDSHFDSGDPGVAAGAKRYQTRQNRNPYPLDTADSVLQSPTRFSEYVANTVYATLPRR